MSLEIRLLGAPQIEVDGAAVATDRRKAVALLAYLAVTGRSHTRDALAALLWPDYEQSSAYAYLRRTLWEIRQQIGDAWLDANRSTVTLPSRDDLFVDVTAFEHSLDESATAQELEQALSLYRGDFLEGFSLRDAEPFDEWQRLESQRLRLLMLEGREQLARARRRAGDADGALDAARALVAADPLHEPGQQLLVELLAESGDRTGALRHYESFAAQLAEELDAAPGAALREVVERIRTGRFAPTPRPDPTPDLQEPPAAPPALHLPAATTPFVGRREQLADLARLLNEPDARLINLTGPGGTGKTRLALEAAARNAHLFADGVCFVPLAGVRVPDSIVPAIIQALNLPLQRQASEADARAQLLDFLAGRQMLLVLDNFEQLVAPGGGHVLTDLLTAAPRCTLLTTSRIRLNVRAEQLLPVGGLHLPPPDTPAERLPEYSAITLFIQSARRLEPDFAVDDHNGPAVLDICALVQGTPLGIELAASWINLLTPAEIAGEIRHSLDFLETELQDIPPRQRSINAVFDSTWQLLTEREQDIFPRLALFPAGFNREAAAAVSGANLRDLLGLTNKSLVRREERGRFVIHELLRQFGEGKLQSDPEIWRKCRRVLAEHYLAFVAQQIEDLKGPRQHEALERVAADIENIRLAWEWACDLGLFEELGQALEGLGIFFNSRALVSDLGPLSKRALRAADENGLKEHDPALYSELFVAHAAAVTFEYHHYDQRLHEAALTLLRERGLEEFRTFLILFMIIVMYWPLQMEDTRWLLEEGLALARRRNEPWEVASLLDVYGDFMRYARRPTEALKYLAEGYEIARELGNDSLLARLRRSMAELAREHGNYAEATRLFNEALERHRRLGDMAEVAAVYYRLGDNEVGAGRYEEAIDYYRKAHHAYERAGYHLIALDMLSWMATCLLRLGRLDEALALRRDILEQGEELQSPNRGWFQWDIGEVLRVGGDTAAARDWYQRGRPIFERIDDPLGLSLIHRGLGDAALMEGKHAEARREFKRFRESQDELINTWGIAYASSGLGRVAVATESFEEARQELGEGLRLGQSVGDRGLVTLALTGLAELALAGGEAEPALVLAGFVQEHHATWYEHRQVAARVEKQAARQVSPAAARAARSHGAGLALEDAVDYAKKNLPHG